MPITVPGELPESAYTQRVPLGTVYQAPRAVHTQVHHYCYPTAGVEMRLGDEPVMECNRWVPVSELVRWRRTLPPGDYQAAQNVRDSFRDSPEGKEYLQAVQTWEAARAAEQDQAREMEVLVERSLEEARVAREAEEAARAAEQEATNATKEGTTP